MSSLKAMFCDLCIILLFGLTIVFAEEKPSGNTTDVPPTGLCSCGGFPTNTPAVDAMPLLSQSPGLVTKCDEEGQITCKSLCNALATATKAKGPEILCNKLKEANELKLSAFFKLCDKPWTYADITAEEPLCCEEGKVKKCLSATSVDVIDAKTVM